MTEKSSYIDIRRGMESAPRASLIKALYAFGFIDDSDGNESASNAEKLGLIPGLTRSPGRGHGNPV